VPNSASDACKALAQHANSLVEELCYAQLSTPPEPSPSDVLNHIDDYLMQIESIRDALEGTLQDALRKLTVLSDSNIAYSAQVVGHRNDAERRARRRATGRQHTLRTAAAISEILNEETGQE
jgi:2-keto-4-pentenoate hydratase